MDAINLALLPPLDVVEQVDYETILAATAETAGIENLSPSDPQYRIALACAYRESLVRQDANEQARGLMLAFATGPQLDHIGVTYYKQPDGSPVTRLDGEEDDDYRLRLQASPEGLSVAGPEAAYQFHAKSASALVKDIGVDSPEPVTVDLYVLSYAADGVPDAELLNAIANYLEPRRPLTDYVRVNAAEIVAYSLSVVLDVKPGPDPELVRQLAEKNLTAYVELRRVLGGRVTASGIYAAVMVEGVEEANLGDWVDVLCTKQQAPYCNDLAVTLGGNNG
jgi:phage-related baseplate assembly protein